MISQDEDYLFVDETKIRGNETQIKICLYQLDERLLPSNEFDALCSRK